MNIKKLEIGKKYKYKELCEVLGIEPTSKANNSRIAQFKELSRHCEYEKQGHSIIINQIYDISIAKKENRGGNNNIYAKDINAILTSVLYSLPSKTKDEGIVSFTRNYLYNRLALVNGNYKNEPAKTLVLSDILDLPSQIINEFYHIANTKLWGMTERALNSMQKQGLITWSKGYNLAFEPKKKDDDIFTFNSIDNNNHKIANKLDIAIIKDCENRVLNRLEMKDKQELVLKKQYNRFYELMNEELQEEYINLEYYYETIVISFNSDVIDNYYKSLEYDSIQDIRTKLNDKVIECLKRAIKQAHKKAKDTINTKKYITSYDRFRASDSYVKDINKVMNILIPRYSNPLPYNIYDGTKVMRLKHQWDSMYGLTSSNKIRNFTTMKLKEVKETYIEGFQQNDMLCCVGSDNEILYFDEQYLPF